MIIFASYHHIRSSVIHTAHRGQTHEPPTIILYVCGVTPHARQLCEFLASVVVRLPSLGSMRSALAGSMLLPLAGRLSASVAVRLLNRQYDSALGGQYIIGPRWAAFFGPRWVLGFIPWREVCCSPRGQDIGLDGRCAPSVGRYALAFSRQVSGLGGCSCALGWVVRLFLRSGCNHALWIGL